MRFVYSSTEHLSRFPGKVRVTTLMAINKTPSSVVMLGRSPIRNAAVMVIIARFKTLTSGYAMESCIVLRASLKKKIPIAKRLSGMPNATMLVTDSDSLSKTGCSANDFNIRLATQVQPAAITKNVTGSLNLFESLDKCLIPCQAMRLKFG